MSMSSPLQRKKSSRLRPFRVLILGQPAVGKTALTVRFITKRFIGEYDPTLERKYTFKTEVDGEIVTFELLDTAGQSGDTGPCEENIRWADAYVIIYDVTDRCSFDECTRLKFLVNMHAHRKSRKISGSNNGALAQSNDIPVALVGNKNDLEHERMVTFENCKNKHEELGCTSYHDISVRESIEEVREVFVELFRVWPKQLKKISRTSPPLLMEKFRSFSEGEQVSAHNAQNSQQPTDESRNNTVKRKESVSRKFMKRMMSSRSMRIRIGSDGDKPTSSSGINDSDAHA